MYSTEHRQQRIHIPLSLLYFVEIHGSVGNDGVGLAAKNDLLHALRQLVPSIAKPGVDLVGINLRGTMLNRIAGSIALQEIDFLLKALRRSRHRLLLGRILAQS